MADWYGGTNDSGSRAAVHLAVWEASADYANNRSLVSFYMDVYDNNGSYGGYGTGSWSANIAGVGYSGSLTYDFTGNSGASYRVLSSSIWVPHDGVGASSIYSSGDFSGSSPVGYASAGGWLGLTDFAYPPATPGTATLTRTSDGTSITATSAIPASSAATITSYEYRTSTDNSTWGAATAMGGTGGRVATFTGVSTTTYYVQTRAGSPEGWSAWSSSASIVGVPTAPASIGLARNGRDVTVTSGSSTGTGITGYYVQYSTDGSTWSTEQLMTSQTYTYTALTPALTYTFRTKSLNAIGYSAPAVSTPLFVPAGGKRFDGTAFNSTATFKRFDGTSWNVVQTAKRSNGTSWLDLS